MFSRRQFVAAAGAVACGPAPTAIEPIRVGVLHSATGAMAASEEAVALATLHALRGLVVLGRPVEAIRADGASDPAVFAREAARLVGEQGVAVVFGGWTSSSRRAMAPALQAARRVLVYPLQYEGLDSAPNVLFTGSTPNQQILPALRWAAEKFGPRLFLVGSDYVFPRVANAVIRDFCTAMGTEPVGEAYLPLDATDAAAVVAEIQRARPSIVVSTVNGLTGNLALFRTLRRAHSPALLPSLSFSLAEPEARAMVQAGVPVEGEYAAWTWLYDPQNRAHIALESELRAAASAPTMSLSDPMVSAMAGVQLWAAAVSAAGEAALADSEALMAALAGRSVAVGGDTFSVDGENQHVWKPTVVGRFDGSARLQLAWRSALPERPRPYPGYRTKEAWERVLSASG